MGVRDVRVTVLQRRVLVTMAVDFVRTDQLVVDVLMVHIVCMNVLVDERQVMVMVFVALPQQ